MEKAKKVVRTLDSAHTVYVGFSSLIGGIMGFYTILVMTYRALFGGRDFSWGVFIFFLIFSVVLTTMGYLLIRSGGEQFRKK